MRDFILPEPVDDTDWDDEALRSLQRAANLGFNNREANVHFIDALKRGIELGKAHP